jgi:hypothetical protein
LGRFEELADQVCTHVTTGREGMLAAIRVTLKSRFSVGIQARQALQVDDWGESGQL